MMKRRVLTVLSTALLLVLTILCNRDIVYAQQASPTKAVYVQVDLKKTVGPMYPAWAWFGYDEPNYTYMTGLPAKRVVIREYRIDDNYSNSFEVWKNMGSPQQPTAEQIQKLEQAGQLKQSGSSDTP